MRVTPRPYGNCISIEIVGHFLVVALLIYSIFLVLNKNGIKHQGTFLAVIPENVTTQKECSVFFHENNNTLNVDMKEMMKTRDLVVAALVINEEKEFLSHIEGKRKILDMEELHRLNLNIGSQKFIKEDQEIINVILNSLIEKDFKEYSLEEKKELKE